MQDSFYTELVMKNAIPIFLGLAGFIFVAIGLFTVFSHASNKSTELQFQAGNSSKADNTASQVKVVVDIEGGVIKPGVYTLSDGSRMHDIIVACGGLSAEADRDWFAKNLNQAAKLTDGQKIYIPRVGESISTADSTSIVSNSNSTASININLASVTDLDSLPGIGPVTAQKIIDGRPYTAINDLISKKVVSSSVFEKIKDKITAN